MGRGEVSRSLFIIPFDCNAHQGGGEVRSSESSLGVRHVDGCLWCQLDNGLEC